MTKKGNSLNISYIGALNNSWNEPKEKEIQTISNASAFISLRLSECGHMCNALEINSKAFVASGDVLFSRSSLHWDTQSVTLCRSNKST
jgi:hypothetical protein